MFVRGSLFLGLVPIHKDGNQLETNNYRTITIVHILAKIYGYVLEVDSQLQFRRTYSTLDYIFTERGGKSKGQKVCYCFEDFKKAFDTIPCTQLFLLWKSLISMI